MNPKISPPKIGFLLFFFGLLTIYAALSGHQNKRTYSPVEVTGSSSNLELFIEPQSSRSPLLDRINSSRQEILLEVYLLSDKEIVSALKEAQSRGVTTKILLEQHPFGGGNLNQNSFADLQSSGVDIKWTNPTFALTHEKTIIFDTQTACILNQNLTKSAFTTNREYNVCTSNHTDVIEAVNIFNLDWNRQSLTPANTNLVISPETSRGKLTALISSAQKSLDIEMEIVDDPDIQSLLASKAKSITVRLLVPLLSRVPSNQPAIKELQAAGVFVKQLGKPYLHAKLILVDNLRAYTGSVNFSTASLDQNRELGILISQPDIIDQLSNSFTTDWQNSL